MGIKMRTWSALLDGGWLCVILPYMSESDDFLSGTFQVMRCEMWTWMTWMSWDDLVRLWIVWSKQMIRRAVWRDFSWPQSGGFAMQSHVMMEENAMNYSQQIPYASTAWKLNYLEADKLSSIMESTLTSIIFVTNSPIAIAMHSRLPVIPMTLSSVIGKKSWFCDSLILAPVLWFIRLITAPPLPIMEPMAVFGHRIFMRWLCAPAIKSPFEIPRAAAIEEFRMRYKNNRILYNQQCCDFLHTAFAW